MSRKPPDAGGARLAKSGSREEVRRPLTRFVLGALSCSALAACTTVGPNFKSPDAPAASDYAMAGDRMPPIARLSPDVRTAGPWWKALGSTDLDAVMNEALVGNQTVAAADADLEKALAEVGSARGNLDPRLDMAASAGRERINFQTFGFPNIPNPTINVYTIGGTVAYDLDLFGGGRRTVEAAEATAQSVKWRADAAYLSLTGNVALQAVRIAALRAELAEIAGVIADDRRNIDLIRAGEAAGGEPESATISGRAQLAADEAMAPPVQRELSAARHAMALLVGRSPAEWTPPEFDVAGFSAPTQAPVALPSALVHSRPDILAAEAMLHADTARIGVAAANLYPDVKLTGTLTQGAIAPDKLFSYNSTGWMIGPSITAPLLNGGQLRADKRAAEAQARATLAKYRQTVLTAFVQVADVLTALAHDEDQLTAVAHAEGAARSALDEARNALRLGGGSTLQVVDAQRQLDRTRLQRVQAQGQKLADIVTLFTATGADWRERTPQAAGAPLGEAGGSKTPGAAQLGR